MIGESLTVKAGLTTVAAIGGTVASFLWVPDALDGIQKWAGEDNSKEIQEFRLDHDNDMRSLQESLSNGFRDVNVEMATSLHRAVEASDTRARIHDLKLEILKLEMELRRTTDQVKIKEIERSIDKLDKDIEREKDAIGEIKKLTKAQIAELIGQECCEHHGES